MNCCQCKGIESIFDHTTAAKDLKAYRKKGPNKTTRVLLMALKTVGVEGKTLLDIGGGVGAIQHDLAGAGAGGITNVDASAAFLETAQQEAQRHGYADRASYRHGDFVDLAPQIETADIVTLDRVLCCYHDMASLVGLSASRASELYGLVYPRDTWWIKLLRPIMNTYFWLRRNPFRFFVHPTQAVDDLVRRQGLKRHFYLREGLWQVVVYQRGASGADGF
jgi:magnesium-protoporphyrin O-methyltransferase